MNETWSQFTDAEVTAELTPAEKVMLTNLRNGEDKLPDIVARVIDQVRKSYSDGGREVDTNAGTIPDGEKVRAIAIARWKLLTSYPQLRAFQTAERKKASEDAEAYFMEVAKREIPTAGGSEVVSSQTRRATRPKMEGLI